MKSGSPVHTSTMMPSRQRQMAVSSSWRATSVTSSAIVSPIDGSSCLNETLSELDRSGVSPRAAPSPRLSSQKSRGARPIVSAAVIGSLGDESLALIRRQDFSPVFRSNWTTIAVAVGGEVGLAVGGEVADAPSASTAARVSWATRSSRSSRWSVALVTFTAFDKVATL